MSEQLDLREAIRVDSRRNLFKMSRRNFVEPDILRLEGKQIFDRCWLYLGHTSEIGEPGIFSPASSPAGRLFYPRQRWRTACPVQHLPPPRCAGLPRAPGQQQGISVFLSRLDLRPERRPARATGQGKLCRRLQQRRRRQHGPRASVRNLPRFRLCLF